MNSLLLLLGLLPIVDPSSACSTYEVLARNLYGAYQERPVARAVAGSGDTKVVVFASPKGETWAIVSVHPREHFACVIAAGTGWSLDGEAL